MESRALLACVLKRLEVVNRLEASVAIAESHHVALSPSILAKAFRGELVEQDPNDEPASVMLERLAAERAATEPSKLKPAPTKRARKAR